jgi:hypothetical protein
MLYGALQQIFQAVMDAQLPRENGLGMINISLDRVPRAAGDTSDEFRPGGCKTRAQAMREQNPGEDSLLQGAHHCKSYTNLQIGDIEMPEEVN